MAYLVVLRDKPLVFKTQEALQDWLATLKGNPNMLKLDVYEVVSTEPVKASTIGQVGV